MSEELGTCDRTSVRHDHPHIKNLGCLGWRPLAPPTTGHIEQAATGPQAGAVASDATRHEFFNKIGAILSFGKSDAEITGEIWDLFAPYIANSLAAAKAREAEIRLEEAQLWQDSVSIARSVPGNDFKKWLWGDKRIATLTREKDELEAGK